MFSQAKRALCFRYSGLRRGEHYGRQDPSILSTDVLLMGVSEWPAVLEVLREYRISNAQVSIRCDATMDDIIDTLEAPAALLTQELGLSSSVCKSSCQAAKSGERHHANCAVTKGCSCQSRDTPARAIENTAQRFMS